MKSLSRLESLIAEIVERPAWGLSTRRLHPLDLTTALVKAMELRAIRLADRILAPDSFDLRLNPDDLRAIADAQPVLERELGEYLLRTYEERDLSCNLPPVVRLVAASEVKPGRVSVSAGFSPPPAEPDRTMIRRPPRHRESLPPRAGPPAAANSAVARSDGNGISGAQLELIGPDGAIVRTFVLDQAPVIIGRRSTTNIPLLDAGVSREHARIEPVDGGYAIVDLNSTNGTFVNGLPVQARYTLHDGDLLGIGRFKMRFGDRRT